MPFRLYTAKDLSIRAEVVWDLLVDTATWPEWGPSVRGVDFEPRYLFDRCRGEVRTVGGVRLPFEVTEFEDGRRWAWEVAGVPATDHVVTPLGEDRCRLAFGAPALAFPYLGVCRLAIARIGSLAGTLGSGSGDRG